MITLTTAPFSPSDMLRDFTAISSGAGGIVSFSGHVRPDTPDGPVEALHLEAHPVMTERGMQDALTRAKSKWPLISAQIIHRIGTILPGEAIVFVAAASTHRRDAFQAADFLMDYLKTEAIFWKKETGSTGAHWIEPRSQDYADNARWAQNGDA